MSEKKPDNKAKVAYKSKGLCRSGGRVPNVSYSSLEFDIMKAGQAMGITKHLRNGLKKALALVRRSSGHRHKTYEALGKL